VCAVGALSLVALLAGCGGGGDGVHVDGFHLATADRRPCTDLLAALPSTLADQKKRTVTGSVYAAAWGDPAIVLRCGVGRPKGFDRFSQCQRTNGIDWFVPESTITDLGADVVMTTVGRSPALEVHLPAHYRPAGSAAAMVDLALTIKAHTTRTTPCT
jgi:hypothetical protein